MATQTKDLTAELRRAVWDSGRSLNALAKSANMPYAVVHGFANGNRDIYLTSAAKIAATLGLELRPVGRTTKGR